MRSPGGGSRGGDSGIPRPAGRRQVVSIEETSGYQEGDKWLVGRRQVVSIEETSGKC